MKNVFMLLALIFSVSSFAQGFNKRVNLNSYGFEYNTASEAGKKSIKKIIYSNKKLEFPFKAFDEQVKTKLTKKIENVNSALAVYILHNTVYLKEKLEKVSELLHSPDHINVALNLNHHGLEDEDHYNVTLERNDILGVSYKSPSVGLSSDEKLNYSNLETIFNKIEAFLFDSLVKVINREENKLRAEAEDLLKDYGSIEVNESSRGLKKDVKDQLKLAPQTQKANLI